MASKKDKILENAQRFVLKGQIEKAIKEYQQVVAMEPHDIRYRQRLAELLVRDNRKEEAVQQYEDIGKHYADNCYFLKAIAIYKQIQRLNPGHIPTALSIAWLNHQQGLIGNAMAEYGQVVAHYEKEALHKEALAVVEKMLGVDADHLGTRLKYAELLYATGDKPGSRLAFRELAAALAAKGQHEEAASVSARIARLFPGEEPAVAASKVAAGDLPLDAFRDEEIPGGSTPSEVSWEEAAPVEEQALPEWESAVEESDDLAEPFAPTAPAAQSSAPEQPVEAFEAPAPWEEPSEAVPSEGGIAWEEEIELDLGDDLGAAAAPVQAPPAALQPVEAEPEAAAPVDEVEPAEIELPLDFSLELDFDDAAASLAEAAPEEEPHSAFELDLEGEASLAPMQEAEPFGEAPWGELEPEAAQAQTASPEAPEAFELERFGGDGWLTEPEPAAEELSHGWEEIYPEAAGALEAEPDLEELESHYDLGIGYKEMGMYAGAIKELEIAAANPHRRFACLTLQAICYREKGEPAAAEELLRRGLALDVISDDERVTLKYELALLLEGAGRLEEAIGVYREVVRADAGYQDASSRLFALTGEEPTDIIELELEEGS